MQPRRPLIAVTVYIILQNCIDMPYTHTHGRERSSILTRTSNSARNTSSSRFNIMQNKLTRQNLALQLLCKLSQSNGTSADESTVLQKSQSSDRQHQYFRHRIWYCPRISSWCIVKRRLERGGERIV